MRVDNQEVFVVGIAAHAGKNMDVMANSQLAEQSRQIKPEPLNFTPKEEAIIT